MWIEVDSNKEGIKSWVASEHIERCERILKEWLP